MTGSLGGSSLRKSYKNLVSISFELGDFNSKSLDKRPAKSLRSIDFLSLYSNNWIWSRHFYTDASLWCSSETCWVILSDSLIMALSSSNYCFISSSTKSMKIILGFFWRCFYPAALEFSMFPEIIPKSCFSGYCSSNSLGATLLLLDWSLIFTISTLPLRTICSAMASW